MKLKSIKTIAILGTLAFGAVLLSKSLEPAQADYFFQIGIDGEQYAYRCDLLDNTTASNANASDAHAFFLEANRDNLEEHLTALTAILSSDHSAAVRIPMLEKLKAQWKNFIKDAHTQMQRRFGCSLK